MPSKKKTKMNKKKIKLAELQKWLQNIEIITKFVENTGNRYNVRTKLVEIFLIYLSEIKLQLPVPKEKELHLNLMKVLGFCILYFFISFLYFFTVIFNIFILIDSVINYDLKRNREIVKWEGNVVNGILGMKRDANLKLIVFFHSYDDVREV
jgi:hypothetical protein